MTAEEGDGVGRVKKGVEAEEETKGRKRRRRKGRKEREEEFLRHAPITVFGALEEIIDIAQ